MLHGLNPVDFVRGAGYPLRGLHVLRQRPGLARIWLFPIVLTLLALVASVTLAAWLHDELLGLLWAPPEAQGLWGTLLRGGYWLAGVVVTLLSGAVLMVICVALSTVVAAPFNDALSAAVERHVRGGAVQEGAFLRELGRTVLLELAKLCFFLGVMGPLWLISWLIPGVGHAVYVGFAGIFTVSYIALDYIDWPASRRGYSIGRRLGLLRQRPLLLWGFGCSAWLCLFVPLLNLAFMPLSVAGGTLLFLDLERESSGS